MGEGVSAANSARYLRGPLRRLGVDLVRYDRRTAAEAFLGDVLAALEVTHVIDVGANVGQFGLALRRSLRFNGRIDSYEPGAAAFASLADASASDHDWHVHHAALTDRAGDVELHVFPDSDLSSLSSPSSTGRENFDADWTAITERVSGRQLGGEDLPDLGPTFLKIDTQGHDWEVIQGAGEVLDRVCVLMVELSFIELYESSRPGWATIRDLRDLGFGLANIDPITRKAGGYRLIEADGVFVRY